MEPEPTETNMCWPSCVKTTSRVQWPPPMSWGVSRDIGNDSFGRAGGVRVPGVIRNSLHSGGVADIEVLRIVSGIEGDAERMVQAGGKLLDLSGFAVRANAAKDEDRAGARVSEKEIAVGRCPEQPRHRECPPAQFHVLLIVSPLHGGCIAACVKRDFEALRSNGPRIRRARG